MGEGTPRWTCVCGRRCTLDQNRCPSCGEAKSVTALVTTVAPAKAGAIPAVAATAAAPPRGAIARTTTGRIPVVSPGPDTRPSTPPKSNRPAPRPDPTADPELIAYAFPNDGPGTAVAAKQASSSPPKGATKKFAHLDAPPPSSMPPLEPAPAPSARTASGRFAPPPGERQPEYMLEAQEAGAPLGIGEKLNGLFGDERNRDIALMVFTLVVGVIPLRWEMKVWSASQLIETKSYNMLQEDFADDLVKELEAKKIASGVQKNEVQMLVCPGLTGKGSLVNVTIRSPSGGLYAHYEGPSEREPHRCEQVGFKLMDQKTARAEMWQLPGWRMGVPWVFMLVGFGSAALFLIRLLIGGKGE